MAISGLQVINIGLENESANSDSLFTAFNKTKTNFDTLFSNASPYNTFNANLGIGIIANSTNGVVDIKNNGVVYLNAGTGIQLTGNTGNITISSTGNGSGGGTVTSVGILTGSNSRITVTGSPIVSSGNVTLDLATTGVAAGTYTYPTLTVDNYGRLISVSNGASTGTVTSVGLVPGIGIQVTGGPITGSGNISVTNTGVTRLSAGTGIALSGSNGNVTISTLSGPGTVTSVGVASNTLSISGSPIVSSGTISVNLPSTISLSGNLTVSGDLFLNGSEDLGAGQAVNLSVSTSYFSTSSSETATMAPGTNGQVKTLMMVADGGDMVITVSNAGWKTSGPGTITFDTIGDGCTLQYVANKWFVIGNNGCTFA